MKLLQELQAMSKGSGTAKITVKSAEEDYVDFYIKHHPNLKFTTVKGTNAGLVNLTVAGDRLDIINFLMKDMGYKNESKAVFDFPELARMQEDGAVKSRG